MQSLILKCPICADNLNVSRLRCPNCQISIEGEFGMPSLLKLSSAQMDFAEVFIKNRGVIREVERELGVSYPTVRARLDELIQALGFKLQNSAEAQVSDKHLPPRRRAVLADLKAGLITSEQALDALRQIRGAEDLSQEGRLSRKEEDK